MKTYKVISIDIRETVARMSTSQLVNAIAAHATRVEIARLTRVAPPSEEQNQEYVVACLELDARVPRP